MSRLSIEQIRNRGNAVLLRELGPVGYIRFLQDLRPGRGNYTKNRLAWTGGIDLTDFKAKATRKKKAAPKGRRSTR